MPKHIIFTCLAFILLKAVCLIGTILISSKVKNKFCDYDPYEGELEGYLKEEK